MLFVVGFGSCKLAYVVLSWDVIVCRCCVIVPNAGYFFKVLCTVLKRAMVGRVLGVKRN
jgi:hypothetical protein